jgi:hypothetical protein
LDQHTTDCCLIAHGQIVDEDQPFHLEGDPHFADEMDAPPFHWFCRSSVVLYHPAMEEYGLTTAQMRQYADEWLAIPKDERADHAPKWTSAGSRPDNRAD